MKNKGRQKLDKDLRDALRKVRRSVVYNTKMHYLRHRTELLTMPFSWHKVKLYFHAKQQLRTYQFLTKGTWFD